MNIARSFLFFDCNGWYTLRVRVIVAIKGLKNKMMIHKNIFFGVFVMMFVSFITPSFAQTGAPVPVAEVNLQGAKIENQVGNVMNIPFVISNGAQVQTGVQYGVRLVSKKDQTVVYDETVFDETLTLPENSVTKKNIIYTAPAVLSGSYDVYIVLSNTSGFPFALSRIGSVTLTATEKTVLITPESCTLAVSGKKGATQSPLSKMLSLRPGQMSALRCTVTNTLNSTVTVTPSVETFAESLYGASLGQVSTGDPLLFKAGEKKIISLVIPAEKKPQRYTTRIALVGSGITSNTVIARYSVAGVAASIANISLDADYYTAGDTASVSLLSNSFGTKDLSVSIRITSSQGGTCGSLKDVALIPGKQTLSVKISRPCFNPTITASLENKGTVLDEKTLTVATTSTPRAESTFSGTKGSLLLLILVALIAWAGIYLRKKNHGATNIPGAPMAAIILFLATFALGTSAHAGWQSYPASIPYTVGGGALNDISVDIAATPQSMVLPTSQTDLTWITTGNPDTCTATNAWSGTKDQRGASETITGLAVGNHLFEITCVKAGSIDASSSVLVVVANPASPAGTLSATGCTIAANGSSCSGSVFWTTTNLTAAATAITRSTGLPASFTPSPLASGSQATTLGYGQTDFYLYHNAVLLAQSSATVGCAGGTTWNGSMCEVNPPAPTVSLSASPTTIALGDSSVLTWGSTNATACSGFGFNTGGANSGSTSVSPVATTTYTVSCTGLGGSADASATVTVTGTVATACNDGADNDSDTFVDSADPGCHTDGNAANALSYDPNDTSELNKRRPIFKEF